MGSAVLAEVRSGSVLSDTVRSKVNDHECFTTLNVDKIIFDGLALGQGGEGGAIKLIFIKKEYH